MRLKLNPDVKVKPASEIMTGFLAAAVVEQDCWKEEVANTLNNIGAVLLSAGTVLEDAVTAWKSVAKEKEQEFKEKNGLKQMPGKYRSAKSVIMKALENNVELLDHDGFPRGKTEVERDINSTQNKPKDPNNPVIAALTKNSVTLYEKDSPYIKAYWCSQEIISLWPKLDFPEREIIIADLKGTVI